MHCKQCSLDQAEVVWESKSKIEGILGADSPLLEEHQSSFSNNAIYAQLNLNKEIEHPLAYITKENCTECNKCFLTASEAVFFKGKIIFNEIEQKIVRLNASRKKDRSQSVNHWSRKRIIGSLKNSREKYNFNDEPQQIKDAVLFLLKKILTDGDFLSNSQANVVAKIKLGRPLKKSTERNVKIQFKRKLERIENFVDYWDDLEELIYE